MFVGSFSSCLRKKLLFYTLILYLRQVKLCEYSMSHLIFRLKEKNCLNCFIGNLFHFIIWSFIFHYMFGLYIYIYIYKITNSDETNYNPVKSIIHYRHQIDLPLHLQIYSSHSQNKMAAIWLETGGKGRTQRQTAVKSIKNYI